MITRGRYELLFAASVCGEERFEWRSTAGADAVLTCEQRLESPHPLAGEQRCRATVSPDGRVTAVEIDWLVGTRGLHAQHRAEGGLWHVRIDYAGHVREQEGDYPPACEVLFSSPWFHTFALRHYVLAPGAEHEYAALMIGPPYMAVEPGKQSARCVEARELETPLGRVAARRVELHDPAGSEPATTLWIDGEERVLEMRDGVGEDAPLVARLVECASA